MSFFEKSLNTLELPAVLEMLAAQAVGEAAKERALALAPATDRFEVGRRLEETSAAQTTAALTEEIKNAGFTPMVYQNKRTSLLKLDLPALKDYDFWLTLHHELSDKEQDIAALRARLKSYDNLVSYSTFELDLTEVKEYTEPEKEAYGSRLGTAFKESWENFAENFKDFTVGLVRALPALLTFAVISTVIFLCIFLPVRAGIKKRRK